MTYINQRQNNDNRLQLVVYLIYTRIFKRPGSKKRCLERFHSNVNSAIIWNFSMPWKQSDSI